MRCMGEYLVGHPLDECVGMACVIHNPSGHHMDSWPAQWRSAGVLVRICTHSLAHPDPDQFGLWVAQQREHLVVHECDGCCADPSTTQPAHPRTVADVNSDLSILKMVRDVMSEFGTRAVRPTELDQTLHRERDRLERDWLHRDHD